MATAYEWAVEQMDGEDIDDTICFESYAEARAGCGEGDQIVLRKLRSNRDGDSVDTFAYAYLKNGKLPEKFDDGSRVPKRFHQIVSILG